MTTTAETTRSGNHDERDASDRGAKFVLELPWKAATWWDKWVQQREARRTLTDRLRPHPNSVA